MGLQIIPLIQCRRNALDHPPTQHLRLGVLADTAYPVKLRFLPTILNTGEHPLDYAQTLKYISELVINALIQVGQLIP